MPEQQQQQPNPIDPLAQMSWKDKQQFVIGLMTFPAITAQVFLRLKTGFRQLKPTKLIAITALLIVLANVAPEHLPTGFLSSRPLAEASARARSNIPPGFDTAPPATWNVMNYAQRRAWVSQHQLTPEQQRARQERDQAQVRAQQEAAEREAAMGRALVKWPLILFALAFLAWGLIQRRLRWNELCRGTRWHTRSRGVSLLNPFLGRVLTETHITRFADPAVTLLAGLLLVFWSRPLGYWVSFSAFALFVVEQAVYERQLEGFLDGLDNLTEAEVQQENLSIFQQGGQPENHEQRSIQETAGIPTGIAPDIEAQIAKRRGRRERQQQEDKAA